MVKIKGFLAQRIFAVGFIFLFLLTTIAFGWSAWGIPAWGQPRVIYPTDGWPVSHTNAGAAKFTTLKVPPDTGESHYVTGIMMSGGGDGDGFKFVRGATVRLHGANDDITVTNTRNSAPGTNDFVVEMWARLEEPSGVLPQLFDKHDGGAPATGILLQVTAADKLQFNIADGAEEAIFTTDDALSLEAWHHIVVSCDRSSFCKIYVDNVDVGVTASGDSLADVADNIGNSTDLTMESTATLGVRLNCVGYFNGGFYDATDVAAQWNGGYGKKWSGIEDVTYMGTTIDSTRYLLYAYNMDEGTGTTATNIFSPGVNDATLTGTVDWETATDMIDLDDVRPKDDHLLDETTMITCGALSTNGVFPGVYYTFPHAIKIGVGNSLYISETDGAFTLLMFGFTE